jgi:hypothetical protein
MNDKLTKKLSRDLGKAHEPDQRIEDIKHRIPQIRQKYNLQRENKAKKEKG